MQSHKEAKKWLFSGLLIINKTFELKVLKYQIFEKTDSQVTTSKMSEINFSHLVKLRICYFQHGIGGVGQVLVEGKIKDADESVCGRLRNGKHVKVSMWLRDYDLNTYYESRKTCNLDLNKLAKAETIILRCRIGEAALSDLGQCIVTVLEAYEIVEYNFPESKIGNNFPEKNSEKGRKCVTMLLETVMRGGDKIIITGRATEKNTSEKAFLNDWEYCKIECDQQNVILDLDKLSKSKFLDIEVEETLRVGLLPFPWFRSEKEVKIFKGKSVFNYCQI